MVECEVECEGCENIKATSRFVLGYITDGKYIDLCHKCSEIFENIPDHIPDEQNVKYLKAKIL